MNGTVKSVGASPVKSVSTLLSVAAFLVAGAGVSQAAPQPTGMSGQLSAGSVITVRGSGFGSAGPNITLFEDFETSSPGSSVRSSDPPIGSWDELSNNPVVASEARSGNGSLNAYDGSRQRMLKRRLGQKQREIFVSYWVRLASGSRFPGQTSGTNQFSNDSSWKFAWLMNTDEGHQANDGLFDLCFPTHTGGGQFQLGGNSYEVSERYLSNNWWSWNDWMRISMWIRNPMEKSSGGTFEVVSADRGHYVVDFSSPTNKISHSNQVFDVLNIPGWTRSDGGSSVKTRYDDIYVSTGSGAAARVELANSSNYNNASKVELLLVENWGSSQVAARLPRRINLSGESWYIFVTDANGSRNNAGLVAQSCTNCEPDPDPQPDAVPNPPQLTLL
jgi:hypothetical protein